MDINTDSPTATEHMMPSRNCLHCGQPVTGGRLYFGVLGPFCNVQHRDAFCGLDAPQSCPRCGATDGEGPQCDCDTQEVRDEAASDEAVRRGL